MRVFIAIELEDTAKAYLEQVQQTVRGYCRRGNFTPKENLHMTLRFLGEVDSDDIEMLKEAMYVTAQRNCAFSLSLDRLGAFPRGNSGVLWAGVKKSSSLERLFSMMEKNLMKEGFSREKKGLSPHITLGRDVVPQRDFSDLQKKCRLEEMELPVTKITLMESVRRGPALVYRPLFTAECKEK